MGRPAERLYSYTAINMLKVSGMAMLYQPLYGINTRWVLGKTPSERGCQDRWDLFSARVNDGPGSYLDLGSQLGYFGFKMTERGYVGIGMERDRPSCSVARHLARLKGIDSALFYCTDITPETLRAMPVVDVTFCLSIFHHWVREHNLEYADAVMRAVADRCGSRLFFEAGQSNEQSGSWPKLLSFMGSNPKDWIMTYLGSLGFEEVDCLGEVPSHLSSTPRYLFTASRPKA